MSNSDPSEMVERVAKAIWDTCGNNWAFISERDREVTMRQARAVIEAMREPTEAMAMAMARVCDSAPGDPIFEVTEWKAAIDAALGKP